MNKTVDSRDCRTDGRKRTRGRGRAPTPRRKLKSTGGDLRERYGREKCPAMEPRFEDRREGEEGGRGGMGSSWRKSRERPGDRGEGGCGREFDETSTFASDDEDDVGSAGGNQCR